MVVLRSQRLVAALLAVGLVVPALGVAPHGASAQAPLALKVLTDKAVYAPGDEVTVSLSLLNVPASGLGKFSVNLGYDSTLLDPSSFTSTDNQGVTTYASGYTISPLVQNTGFVYSPPHVKDLNLDNVKDAVSFDFQGVTQNDELTSDVPTLATFKFKLRDDITSASSDLAFLSEPAVITEDGDGTKLSSTLGSATVKVAVPITLATLELDKPVASVPLDQTLAISLKGVYSDTTTKDLTQSATWSSADEKILTVAKGVVTPKAKGTTVVTAKVGSKEVTSTVTVADKALTYEGMTLNQSNQTINAGATLKVLSTGVLSDKSTQDVTANTVWESSDSKVASVSTGGVVSALTPGSAIIRGTYQGNTAAFTLTVLPGDKLLSLEIPNQDVELVEGGSLQLKVDGVYSVNGLKTITENVDYNVINGTSVVSVSSGGKISALKAGTATIQISSAGITKNLNLKVTPLASTLSSLSVTPSTLTVKPNDKKSLALTGTYSNNTTKLVGDTATWTSSNSSVASVDKGVVTGLQAGTTTITATLEGKTTSVTVTVADDVTLRDLRFDPLVLSFPEGSTNPILVYATYTDGKVVDVTSKAKYSFSQVGIADLNGSVLKGVKQGTTTLTATFDTKGISAGVVITQGVLATPDKNTNSSTPGTKTNTPVSNNGANIYNAVTSVAGIKERLAQQKANGTSLSPTDLSGHWSEDTMRSALANGIIRGYADGTVKPDAPITRSELAAMLDRVFPVTSTTMVAFPDVQGHWAAEPIQRLANAGVVGGYTGGNFKPNQPVTRQELVLILSRLVNFGAVSPTAAPVEFSDLQGVYGAATLNAAAKAGLVSGLPDGRFAPNQKASRAEVVKVLYGVLRLDADLASQL